MGEEYFNEIPVIELFPNGTLNNIALVTSPAIEELFLKFAEEPEQFQFSDDEKHIVTGPVLIPEKKILRYDNSGEPFYVWFSKETIEELSQTFLRDDKNRAWNLQHEQDTNDVYITESWIVNNSELDKAKALGFEVPDGTWMASAKIENEDIWNRIKNNELRGFSIDGMFKIEKNVIDYDEALKKIEEIIKQVE